MAELAAVRRPLRPAPGRGLPAGCLRGLSAARRSRTECQSDRLRKGFVEQGHQPAQGGFEGGVTGLRSRAGKPSPRHSSHRARTPRNGRGTMRRHREKCRFDEASIVADIAPALGHHGAAPSTIPSSRARATTASEVQPRGRTSGVSPSAQHCPSAKAQAALTAWSAKSAMMSTSLWSCEVPRAAEPNRMKHPPCSRP